MNDSDRLKQMPIGVDLNREAVDFLREIAIQLAELNEKLTPDNIFNAGLKIQAMVEATGK